MSTVEEKIKRKEERMDCILKMKMVGAQTILEYRRLEREIKELRREDEYSKWFDDNRELLNQLFNDIFISLALDRETFISYPVATINNTLMIKFGEDYLDVDYTTTLLKKYEYFCYNIYHHDKLQRIEIRCKRREE